MGWTIKKYLEVVHTPCGKKVEECTCLFPGVSFIPPTREVKLKHPHNPDPKDNPWGDDVD